MTFSPTGPPFSKLAKFKTAGFMDFRFGMHSKAEIEYVPIPSERNKRLDCPITLRGLS